jgi:ATP-dependent protease ClpP protease subunit
MNADEAKAFGVIDEVIVSQRELKQEQTKSKKVQ